VRPTRHSDEKDEMPERGIFQQLLGLGRLKPYLWPVGNIGFKFRSILALVLTVGSQFVLVGSPFLLGRAIDRIEIAALIFYSAFYFLILAPPFCSSGLWGWPLR